MDHYLAERFGRLGFMNGHYGKISKNQRWTNTSPQHVTWRDFKQLIPETWLASSFSVVREPTKRLFSAYFFQKEKLRNIPADRTFDQWFHLRVAKIRNGSFFDDNHLIPQSRIVPPNARFFHLEGGLEAVVSHLDQLEGRKNGPRQIAAKNVGQGVTKPTAHRETLDLISEVYAADFERFNYSYPRIEDYEA